MCKLILCVLTTLLLAACGGGDPEPECVSRPIMSSEREQPQWVARCEAQN